MNKKQTRLLYQLLSLPTAPFREQHIIKFVTGTLMTAGIPFFRDPVGNIVVGIESRDKYIQLLEKENTEPLRLFMAHMDHPGFHGVRWLSPRRLEVKWYGGSPVKHVSGHAVWLADDSNRLMIGKLSRIKLVKGKWAMDSAEVILPQKQVMAKQVPAKKLFGSFKFRAPVWRSGQRLYTNAADDLVGVFAIINTAMILKNKRMLNEIPFIGLLTRAEEVGFLGAVGHFELGWLNQTKRNAICISLEASRTLVGAKIGKGPVVRLGDRRTIFEANNTKILTDIAERVLPGKHQRRIMDSGACEATAATVFGLPAIGISLPLGNYHNQGFEGGADCPEPEGPAPEFVNINDIDGELKLCLALMRPGLPWSDPWQKQRNQLHKAFQRHQRLFK